MTAEETAATWQSWLLDAIHKIRYQKQRPNVDRISGCVRMHHPQYSNEAVQEHLDACVESGAVARVVNKGMVSYRDPESAPGRGQKTLHVNSADMDLTRMFVRAVRETSVAAELPGVPIQPPAAPGLPGSDADGSDLRTIERHIRGNFAVEVSFLESFRKGAICFQSQFQRLELKSVRE